MLLSAGIWREWFGAMVILVIYIFPTKDRVISAARFTPFRSTGAALRALARTYLCHADADHYFDPTTMVATLGAQNLAVRDAAYATLLGAGVASARVLGMILLLRRVCGPSVTSEGLSVAPSSDFLVCTGGQSRTPCYLAGFQWPGDWRGFIEEEDDGAISSEESTGTPSSGIPNAMTWLDGV